MDLIDPHRAVTISPERWPVALGRGPWVEEVWENCISTTIRSGDEPQSVKPGADEAPGGAVRFWERDIGRGLMPDEQTTLFSPFTRLKQVRGTGHRLGLSIVKRIVEKSEVGVESDGIREGITGSFSPFRKRIKF